MRLLNGNVMKLDNKHNRKFGEETQVISKGQFV